MQINYYPSRGVKKCSPRPLGGISVINLMINKLFSEIYNVDNLYIINYVNKVLNKIGQTFVVILKIGIKPSYIVVFS